MDNELNALHVMHVDAATVITVNGGKLTTYRRMAADTIDEAVKQLDVSGRRPSRTKHVRLHGAAGWDSAGLPNVSPTWIVFTTWLMVVSMTDMLSL